MKTKKKTARKSPPKPETRFTIGTYKAEVTRDDLREYMDWMLLGACKGYPVQDEALMAEMSPEDFFGWAHAVCQTFLDSAKWGSALTMRQLHNFASLDEAIEFVWRNMPKERPQEPAT